MNGIPITSIVLGPSAVAERSDRVTSFTHVSIPWSCAFTLRTVGIASSVILSCHEPILQRELLVEKLMLIEELVIVRMPQIFLGE
jgi:hypothetical protein